MKFSEDFVSGTQIINAYDDNSITINEQRFSKSLIVSHSLLITDWPVENIHELNETTLQPVIEQQPEVIIIGTGRKILFPSPEHYASAIKAGIGIEFMDTGAACRTYNILLAENRKVTAAIILP